MKRYKIQSLASLEREMRAVARSEQPATADAALMKWALAKLTEQPLGSP